MSWCGKKRKFPSKKRPGIPFPIVSGLYTPLQKKRNFSEVAFLLRRSVGQWTLDQMLFLPGAFPLVHMTRGHWPWSRVTIKIWELKFLLGKSVYEKADTDNKFCQSKKKRPKILYHPILLYFAVNKHFKTCFSIPGLNNILTLPGYWSSCPDLYERTYHLILMILI